MQRWRWALLIFELFLFAIILILPQVELPATAFQGGTAPAVIKARISSSPVLATVLLPLGILLFARSWKSNAERTEVPAGPDSHSRLALLCTLIC
jgi:hypothetical protein